MTSVQPTATIDENPEAELASRYVAETNRHVFLTGRAGTGKTTFLHRIREEVPKQLAVVAPTGVAAINAKGTTIHSLFQLPFGLLTPDRLAEQLGRRNLKKEKARLIKGLDLLIIDEISMVRADVLDAIDYTLRRYRSSMEPFGGVQLLMIGDLHQLPPVVKRSEEYAIREHYGSPYFFNSKAIQRAQVVHIELTKVYRQRDDTFVTLLNRVRNNDIDANVLAQLNAQYDPSEEVDEGVITLTSHRDKSQEINDARLDSLEGEGYEFKATVSGKFPPSSYPTEENLVLKIGAQVMFVKNDPPPERAYYNGKIGKITDIQDGVITVSCPEDKEPIKVETVKWANTEFKLNKTTNKVEEVEVGSFQQIPLRLAWAITIHKSQGLTFDHVAIDANAAFAHGQVYVALSRSRSLEGIQLLSKIEDRSVHNDYSVDAYAEKQTDNQPSNKDLDAAKIAYRKQLIVQVFDFRQLRQALHNLFRFYLERQSSFTTNFEEELDAFLQECDDLIFAHADNYVRVLKREQEELDFSAAKIPVTPRTIKATGYFIKQLESLFEEKFLDFSFATDNAAVYERTLAYHTEIRKLTNISIALLEALEGPLLPAKLVRIRVKTDLETLPDLPNAVSFRKVAASDVNTSLLQRLLDWRTEKMDELDTHAPNKVLPTKVLIAIAKNRPTTKTELKKVKGVGPKTIANYGHELLGLTTG